LFNIVSVKSIVYVHKPYSMGRTTAVNRNVVIFSSLGSFTFGYQLSAMSSCIGIGGFLDYFNINLTGPNANPDYGNRMQGGRFGSTSLLKP
jgi:hypothetical protein